MRRGFSPRAWGWSGVDGRARDTLSVLPTRVGMVRRVGFAVGIRHCSPHARGDGPFGGGRCTARNSFSPRAWGWSVSGGDGAGGRFVLPTRVGMVRLPRRPVDGRFRSPHARGDGPGRGWRWWRAVSFSPRAWGWSGYADGACRRDCVLPTRVGMVRIARETS